MELFLGFLIALSIALTGAGAGAMTAPALILFLHLPVPEAVGTALIFSAAVKLVAAPVQMWRGHVAYGALGWMLLTGLPGVIAGTLLFERVGAHGNRAWLALAVGATIAISSAWRLYCCFRPTQPSSGRLRLGWLAAAMLPIGADVGLSSSGSGALASVALLSFTSLDPAAIVGTDMVFGLCLSLTGGVLHALHGGCDLALLAKLALGGVLGVIAGLGFAPHLPMRILRVALSAWLLAVGVQLCAWAIVLVRG